MPAQAGRLCHLAFSGFERARGSGATILKSIPGRLGGSILACPEGQPGAAVAKSSEKAKFPVTLSEAKGLNYFKIRDSSLCSE
jgi:hypothetical protein